MNPVVVQRAEQPYVSISSSVTMGELGVKLPPQIGEVFEWLESHRIPPVGPPFWKYNVIDMDAELAMEVGVPTSELVGGDSRVQGHVLPDGAYVFAHHVGHPDDLVNATRDLLDWAAAEGHAFDVTAPAEGEVWAARFEEYLSSPETEPDMNRWETNLFFRLAQ